MTTEQVVSTWADARNAIEAWRKEAEKTWIPEPAVVDNSHLEKGVSITPNVYRTPGGVYYLREPGVALLAEPRIYTSGIVDFLKGYSADVGFDAGINDYSDLDGNRSATLSQFAGQLCYLSFGSNRTPLSQSLKYYTHIKESGHGSVLEHANYSFLFYGISRTVTHELVRHRSGMGYSQVSQRYVDGSKLRFVERPEFSDDLQLHNDFVARIEQAYTDYDRIAHYLENKQIDGHKLLQGDNRGERRKAVNQTARESLPNETEAPIVATGNVRAWRHILEQRCSVHAERPIRRAMMYAYTILRLVAPEAFEDYKIVHLDNGDLALNTPYRKV